MIGLTAVACARAPAALAAPRSSIGVDGSVGITLTPVCENDGAYDVALTNHTEATLTGPYQLLPWAVNSLSMRYEPILVSHGKQTKLDRQYIVADYFTSFSLPSGKTLRGTLHLQSIVPNLSKVRRSGNVVIFWYFDSDALVHPNKRWKTGTEGVILLPQKTRLSSLLLDTCGVSITLRGNE